MSTAQTIDRSYLTRPDCKDLDHIPGTDGLPYFGEALKSIWHMDKLVEEHYKRWGEVSRIKMLHQRGVLILGVDNYQTIYLDRDQNFSAEMGFAESIGQFYKGGVLMKDFDEHKLLRRLLQTAFKNKALQSYIDVLNPIMEQHVESADKVSNFEFFPFIKNTLLEIGAKIFIGAEAGEQTDKLNQAFLDINEGLLGQVRKEIPGTRYYKGKKAERFLRSYFASEIPKRRGKDLPDMFSIMCNEKGDDGQYFSDELIIPQAAFLLFAAHDTTTSALNHIMYYTAIYPEWQERMREQVLAIHKETGKDHLEFEDLEKFDTADLVFNECMRIRPSVAFLARRTIRECEIGGHRIPADTMLFLTPIHNHRDPQYWTNPEQFDPDRFSAERSEHKGHSFCFHPFGGGAHKCIGMHFATMLVKTYLYKTLLKYEYSLPADFKPRFEWAPLPKPAKLPIQWKRR